MGGIVGICDWQSDPESHQSLDGMLKALSHRGPVYSTTTGTGPVLLGNCSFNDFGGVCATYGKKTASSHQFTVTADARIDNFTALRQELENYFPNPDRNDIGNLLIAAYRKWGTRCPYYILGDFTFAIWDQEKQELFLARDPMGVRPLFFLNLDKCFAFSSEIKSFFCLPHFRKRINEEKIADFLVAVTLDTSSTFYKDVYRLPPATTLLVRNQRLFFQQYWQPGLKPVDYSISEHESAIILDNILKESVTCRLSPQGKIGSTLSGGLDSSTVTCYAAKHLTDQHELWAISARFLQNPECDEHEYAQTILKRYPNIKYIDFYPERTSPLKELSRLQWASDEPIATPQFYMIIAMYRMVRRYGISILLDGHDGDTSFSHGFGRLKELACNRQYLQLFLACQGLHHYERLSSIKEFFTYCFRYALTPKLKSLSFSTQLRKLYKIFQNPPSSQPTHLAHPGFLARTGFESRRKEYNTRFSTTGINTEIELHSRALNLPLLAHSTEELDELAMRNSVELRHPLFDRRLIDFCVSLPSSLKLNNGYTRYCVRQAVKASVPSKIVRRKDKSDLSPSLHSILKERDCSLSHNYLTEKRKFISEYVDADRMDQFMVRFSRLSSIQADHVMMPLWRVAALAHWLEHSL